MISYILELLRDKPEQEQLLLRFLVNKLVYDLSSVADDRVMDRRKSRQRRRIFCYSCKLPIHK